MYVGIYRDDITSLGLLLNTDSEEDARRLFLEFLGYESEAFDGEDWTWDDLWTYLQEGDIIAEVYPFENRDEGLVTVLYEETY